MDNLEAADPESWRAVREAFYRWDDIHIHYRGELLESTGHGFAGMSRMRLLQILSARAIELGVDIRFGTLVTDPRELADADLVVAGDGVHSATREFFAEHFEPDIDFRPNRFVWLGTTCPFPAFTFDFRENEHGLWRLHAYQYEPRHAEADDPEPISTFIVEATEETFANSGLDIEDEAATIRYCEKLFAEQLGDHRLIGNKSIWRQFPTIRNRCWHHDNFVLMGDAVHTLRIAPALVQRWPATKKPVAPRQRACSARHRPACSGSKIPNATGTRSPSSSGSACSRAACGSPTPISVSGILRTCSASTSGSPRRQNSSPGYR